jgi:hypothetical protein
VTGRVTPEDPVSEPEAGVPECLWYRVEWQELREVGDHDMWVTEESDDDECDFSLEDDTGAIWVDNTNAEVKGASRLDRSIGSDERVTGSFLPVAETLTVVGRVVIDPEDKCPMLGPDPDAGLVISTGSPSELGRAERARAASYVLMGSFLCLAGLGLLAGGYLGLL